MAEAALDDPSRMERNVARLVAERDRLAAALEDLGFDVHPSTANFLLCRVGDVAGVVAERLFDEGLVVRRFTDPRLLDHLRFTVRSPEEDDRLIDALRRAIP
ncbi:MAG TPA: aminotransferase class I/II-fold pyridoxal phosphate-dependent enzyme [Actinobacteria bacterium]|nr:aminotransferase class I/II-fold pyridoxal phosphate-dependent enzyme [Actinomycetota bacterium]